MQSPLKATGGGRRPKVLVVDNEPYLLRLAEAALGEKGFAVLTAENGKEALSLFPLARPDVVIEPSLERLANRVRATLARLNAGQAHAEIARADGLH